MADHVCGPQGYINCARNYHIKNIKDLHFDHNSYLYPLFEECQLSEFLSGTLINVVLA